VAQNQQSAGCLAPFVRDPWSFRGPLGRRACGWCIDLAGTVEQHLVVGSVLLADELERPIESLNRTFERPFDVTPAEAQLVDVALDLLETALRLL
jgi:hypothetical protein